MISEFSFAFNERDWLIVLKPMQSKFPDLDFRSLNVEIQVYTCTIERKARGFSYPHGTITNISISYNFKLSNTVIYKPPVTRADFYSAF